MPTAKPTSKKRASKTPAKPVHKVYNTPLPKKLGIAEEMQVALIAAPDGFEESLGELPPGVIFSTSVGSSTGLALCFVRSLSDLAAMTDLLGVRLPGQTHFWIIYPKRAGRYKVDFNENHVREAGLTAGFVDYKVCSVDNDWSGLKFSRRKT